MEFEVARVNGFELLCRRRVFDGHSQVGRAGGREPQKVGPGARKGSGTDDGDGIGKAHVVWAAVFGPTGAECRTRELWRPELLRRVEIPAEAADRGSRRSRAGGFPGQNFMRFTPGDAARDGGVGLRDWRFAAAQRRRLSPCVIHVSWGSFAVAVHEAGVF